MSRNRRRRAQPTHEWEQIELLCAWPEQRRYREEPEGRDGQNAFERLLFKGEYLIGCGRSDG